MAEPLVIIEAHGQRFISASLIAEGLRLSVEDGIKSRMKTKPQPGDSAKPCCLVLKNIYSYQVLALLGTYTYTAQSLQEVLNIFPR